MAILLTTMMVSTSGAATSDSYQYNIDSHNHQEKLSLNKASACFFDTAEQESLAIEDSEIFPFALFDSSFQATFFTVKNESLLGSQSQTLKDANLASIITSRTKTLIFPFHSHW